MWTNSIPVDKVRGALVNGGGVLVTVPTPVRFAFHKLILSQERDAATHGKRKKDLHQAAQILSLLVDERPGDVMIAWDEIQNRGKGWVKRVNTGITSLKSIEPNTFEKVMPLLKSK
jgi:hypothetical protein